MYTFLLSNYSDKTLFTYSKNDIQKYDRRTLWQKIRDVVLSILREYAYSLRMFWNRLTVHSKNYHQVNEKISWKTNSEGLIVCVHGLNGHPSSWNPHINEIKKNKNIDLFVPFVPEKGQCPLEEAADPILKLVLDYIKVHPLKPICLIGVSNGGRIATYIDVKLRQKMIKTAVKVSTIAAVHFGSIAINYLERFGLASLVLRKAVREELAHGSQKALSILNELIKPLPSGVIRDYEFYASTEDSRVPLPSSLPVLKLNEKLRVIHAHGHNSIVKAIHKEQVASCIDWMNKQIKQQG